MPAVKNCSNTKTKKIFYKHNIVLNIYLSSISLVLIITPNIYFIN